MRCSLRGYQGWENHQRDRHELQDSSRTGQPVEETYAGSLAKKQQGDASGVLVPQLYEEIGRLKFELDWLKKKIAKFH